MDMNFDLYMNNIVKQARSEMDHAGYEQLATEEDVDRVFKQDGTTLVMINSVCGCAGGLHVQLRHTLYTMMYYPIVL